MEPMEFEDSFIGRLESDLEEKTTNDSYGTVLSRVRDTLSREFSAEQLANAGPNVSAHAAQTAREEYQNYNNEAIRKSIPRIMIIEDLFVQMVLADLLGMGAIEPLLKDESIEDVAVNGPNEVMVYREGGWEEVDVKFDSSTRLLEILNRGIAYANRKANVVTPIADAVLKGMERISVVTYPVATPYPTAVIRIPRAKVLMMEDLIRAPKSSVAEDHRLMIEKMPDYDSIMGGGMLTAAAGKFLYAAVRAGLNIVVIGPTGVGKTTLLMILGRCIPKGKRVLIIEDTPEIDLYPGTDKPNNVLYLRTRPATIEGIPAIEQEELVKLALRQRPDALTLGEARGAEVFDLLNALNTGHKNGLTSLHAYGVGEMFNRIYLMLAQSERGRFLDSFRAANLVAQTLHVAISMEMVGKERRIGTIAELTGRVVRKETAYEPEIRPIFVHSGTKLDGPMNDSVHARFLAQAGIPSDVYARP
jgi:pilus assembly protein CpaF